MPKGSQQTGSATTSSESRAGAAQYPYFQAGLQNAGRIYGDDTTYPNYAPPDPRQIAGFNAISDTGGNLGGWPTAKQYDAYGNLITGGGQSPATGGYSTLAAGGTGPQQTLDRIVNYGVNSALGYANPIAGYASQAAANNNLGLTELGKFASGGYDANPYLPAAIAAAQRPVETAYRESTAPTTDARFSGGGRYGSGANDAARVRDESALAGSLGDISTNMSYADFKAAMDRKAAAAQQYGQQWNTGLGLGITGLRDAANLVDQGMRTVASAANPNLLAQTEGVRGLDTGFGRQLTVQEQALRDYNNFAQGQLIPAQADIQAGQGLQTLQQQAYNAPFERLRQYMATIGAPSGGTSSTQPIFGNPLTSAISGISGAAGLGKELGLGSLFSGGSGVAIPGLSSAASAGVGALFPGAAQTAAGLAGYAALPEIASSAAAFAPAAAAGLTIVCTELVRQGRMPNTWRLAGMRQFMSYPAIARRGYWVWATPVVAHLRTRPDSLFSKIIETTFNWRAEDLAARNGVKGARRLIRGRLVTAAMVIPCLACGLMTTRDYFPSGKDAPA